MNLLNLSDNVRDRILKADFRKLWLGETVSLFGDQIMLLVLPLIALNICHVSTALSALLPLALNFPFLLLGLPVGAIIERISAKKTMIVSDFLQEMDTWIKYSQDEHKIIFYRFKIEV